jgi:ribulose 1,5-bisphosphate synthetase/thiazole synthase
VIRHDDSTMVQPTPAQIVESVGASTRTDVAACDVVIAEAGPAGLAAAVYAASDARYRSIKRFASAVGDGATAVRLTPGIPG